MLPTQSIQINHFNLNSALIAAGNPLALLDTSDKLSTEQGAMSSGIYDVSPKQLAEYSQQYSPSTTIQAPLAPLNALDELSMEKRAILWKREP